MRVPPAIGFWLIALVTSASFGKEPLPKVPADWRIELVAKAPQILFPTAVVQAPDGTVYLGQDPMDMPGPPTAPIDSVVAIKDGKVRVFAERLWSVMGLEWVDGTLYVVHAPFLSAFRDTDGDGKADERIDLITGLGPKVPGFNGLNDHVASGVRLGMDGFLYISVGDKGIPHGVGKDGTTIQLFGGGVIRIRPDGTGLEVVSTGERNPLSVALTATDEIFTYGNDDDSKRWPNSLTHHIVGGHYGYPYEFLTAPHRALPIVSGEIGGSGTQGVCYNEDGLPASFRGNLFLTDWGLQAVFRFQVEKAGATFALKKRTPFVTRGEVTDFRPFSMAVTNDGRGFLLVDWGFDGWLADGPKTGRLYRLSYVRQREIAQMVRPHGDDATARLVALDHPALSVRLESQRILARQGQVELLTARLKTETPITGRLHALWALDAIGTSPARDAIRAALSDKDPVLRLQAVRNAGIRRDKAAVDRLSVRLRDPDAAVRREAAIALGRIGDPASGAVLMAALGDPDTFTAWSIRQAIRRHGAWDERLLVEALLDGRRRDDAITLTDEAWAVPVVNALALALAKTESPAVRARLVANLAGLYRKYPAWSGHWFGTNPLAGQAPRKTQGWEPSGMESVVRGLAPGLNDADANVRIAAMNGLRSVGLPALPLLRARLERETDERALPTLEATLGALRDVASVPRLAALASDKTRSEPVRVAALEALAVLPGPQALSTRLSIIYNRATPAALVARVLPALGRDGALPANDIAGFLEHSSPEVRAAALRALRPRKPAPSRFTAAALQGSPAARAAALRVLKASREVPEEIQRAVVARLDDPAPDVRRAAMEAAATLKVVAAVPRLIAAAEVPATRADAALALCALADPKALPVYLTALDDRSPDLRDAAEGAILAIRDRASPALQAAARSGTLGASGTLVVERALARFEPIVDWRVIGPFPRTTAQIFIGDPSLDFRRTHTGAEGRTIAWTARKGDPATGRVVLDDFKGGAGDRGGFGYDVTGSPDLSAFAYAEVVSDRDRPALMLAGSSGTMVVIVNERSVPYQYQNSAGRTYEPGSDVVRVDLKKGTNRILVLSRQGIGSWSFSLQLSAPSDLLARSKAATTPEAFRAFADTHEGDPRHGEELFFDAKGLGCAKCHAAGGRGSASVGPDLTGLARKYDKTEIIRSVLEPSNRIATGYQPILVATTSGKVITGLVRSETDDALELIDADAKVTRVAKSDIAERRVSEVSLMPKGLVDTLSVVEFADLINYLRTLKTAPSQQGR